MSGLQVYVFDFCGGSKKSRSGGTMLEMSIFTERDDLNAVIDFIAARPEVDKKNLFLLGESQGGCVSGITAPSHMDQLKAKTGAAWTAYCIFRAIRHPTWSSAGSGSRYTTARSAR